MFEQSQIQEYKEVKFFTPQFFKIPADYNSSCDMLVLDLLFSYCELSNLILLLRPGIILVYDINDYNKVKLRLNWTLMLI